MSVSPKPLQALIAFLFLSASIEATHFIQDINAERRSEQRAELIKREENFDSCEICKKKVIVSLEWCVGTCK
jgi:hypothetical protein